MCGIAGIFSYAEAAPPVDGDELLRIREAMLRRGPDGAGLWLSSDRRIGLAHRRLAIIDLSPGGAQPMATADGRLHVTFNGEIYNYRELRRELEAKGYAFRSHSDTEVLLHLYADRGERMVEALRGMFAFAIWDAQRRELFLARDPFGIKPLYVADDGKTLRFASQVKALLAGGAIDTAPEAAGSVGFFVLGSVPEPYTLYRSIRALPAGSTMRVAHGTVSSPSSYFDVRQEFLRAQDAPVPAGDAGPLLDAAIRDSVAAHLVADVPVGIFLSAGIDSGSLLALAAEAGAKNLRAVTLGFREYSDTDQDEVPLAREAARRYGVEHREDRIERDDFEAELANLLAAMDQPSIDGVNTYFVSRAAARAGMKVALSGLGGDELFGGYPSFRQIPRTVQLLGWMRGFYSVGVLARKLSQHWIGRLTSPKFAGALEYGPTFGGSYLLRRSLFMPWELEGLLEPATVRAGLEQLDLVARLDASAAKLRAPRARVAALELAWYMRNQLLRDTDWAGMAHSLEVRVPLVDARLFRTLAPVVCSARPPAKADLAQAPALPLAQGVVQRAKTGFTTPVQQWIGHEHGATGRGLRGWAWRVMPAAPPRFRVLALVSDAYGGHGGIAKFNRDLLASVAAMPECSEVVCLPRVISRPVEGVPERVRFVAGAAGNKLCFVRAVRRALKEGPYDLVIIGHVNLAALGVWAARKLRAPTLLVVHGIDVWARHASRSVRASLGAIDRIVGVSQLTLDRFNGWAGVDAARQIVLPNCVDLTQFTPGPKPPDLMKQYSLDANSTVLMTFGRLASEERFKGFDEVLEVLPALAAEIPNVVYLVCGSGPDQKRLEQKAATLGLSGRVRFTGFIDEKLKVDYYRLADAYVMPSRGEGFGIVYLEALACGIPVLGSKVDGSREALLGGQLGELVDPARPDEIHAGILRTLSRERGVPDRLEHFSFEAFRSRVNDIVRDVAKLPHRGPADEGIGHRRGQPGIDFNGALAAEASGITDANNRQANSSQVHSPTARTVDQATPGDLCSLIAHRLTAGIEPQ